MTRVGLSSCLFGLCGGCCTRLCLVGADLKVIEYIGLMITLISIMRTGSSTGGRLNSSGSSVSFVIGMRTVMTQCTIPCRPLKI